MTRTRNFAMAAAMVLGSATGLAMSAHAQQQWGPPAQSKYYHNPGNPPTYMAYNTESPRVKPSTLATTRSDQRTAIVQTRNLRTANRRVTHTHTAGQ